MGIVQRVVEIRFATDILYARPQAGTETSEVVPDFVLIVGERNRRIGKKAGRKNVVPAHRTGSIAPVEVKSKIIPGKAEAVPAEISTYIKAVLFSQMQVGLAVQIVEIIVGDWVCVRVIPCLGLVDTAGKQVHIGSPARHHKGGTILLDRSFQGEPGGQQPDAARSGKTLVVAVLQAYVNDRRQATAVLRGKPPFVQLQVFYGVRVERAEKAEQMTGVIDDCLVQYDEVLVAAPAPYKNTGNPFPPRGNTGLQLNRFQDIGFAQQHGDHFHFLGAEHFRAHLGTFEHLFEAIGHYVHCFQLHARGQVNVEPQVCPQQQALHLGLEPDEAERYLHRITRRYGQGIKAVLVRTGACARCG